MTTKFLCVQKILASLTDRFVEILWGRRGGWKVLEIQAGGERVELKNIFGSDYFQLNVSSNI